MVIAFLLFIDLSFEIAERLKLKTENFENISDISYLPNNALLKDENIQPVVISGYNIQDNLGRSIAIPVYCVNCK